MSDTIAAAATLVDIMNDDGFMPNDDVVFEKEVVDEEGNPEAPEDETPEEEVEEGEGEPEEDSEEEEPEEEPEEEKEALFEIEIDGEVYEVNEEELRSGYLRSEEYTKRQAELEELTQAKEAELDQERQKVADYLESLLLEGNVSLQKFKNVNWDQLRVSNPETYRNARLEYMEAVEAQEKRTAQRNQIQSMQNKYLELKQEASLKAQKALAQKLIPELSEPTFISDLVTYGKSIGMTEDSVRGISDATALFVLNQARLYAETQVRRKEAKAKVSKDLPPVVKPGAPKTKAQEEGNSTKRAMAQLSKTHSLRDAANVFMDFV